MTWKRDSELEDSKRLFGTCLVVVMSLVATLPLSSAKAQTTQHANQSASPVWAPQVTWLPSILDTQMSLNSQTFPSIDQNKSELGSAMIELENFLARNPAEQANWLRFLKWNDLHKELNKKDPDLITLIQFEKNLRQNFSGLEMGPFTRVRETIRRLTNTLRISRDPKGSIEYLSDRLKKLYETSQTSDLVKDIDSRRDAAQTIEYLSHANQGAVLVQQLRGAFSRPNVRILLSSELVQRQFARPVNEYNPVREVILGTNIRGDSFMQGSVKPILVNNPTHASMQLNLLGTLSSTSVGFNRGVQVNTTGTASIVACETVTLTDTGLQTLSDTAVDANLSTHIDSIQHRSRLITRIAKKKATQQKPQADAIAEGRMETRIRDQFHEQIGVQLADSNQKLKSLDLRILDRLGLKKPARSSWSSTEFMSLLMKVQDGNQLAAPAHCPMVVQPNGLSIQIHESTIGNLLDPILGGRIIRSEDAEIYAMQLGPLGKGIKKDDEVDWNVALDPFYPVEVKYDDSVITMRVRVTKLEKGDQVLRQSALIQISYRPIVTDGALQFQREGEVKIEFSGRRDQGVKALSLRGFLKTKFSEVFKEQLLDEPLRISDKLPPEFRNLNLVSVNTQDGWLQAHLN